MDLKTQNAPESEQSFVTESVVSWGSHSLSLCDRFYYWSKHILLHIWWWIETPTLSISEVTMLPSLDTLGNWEWHFEQELWKPPLLLYATENLGLFVCTAHPSSTLIDTVLHTKWWVWVRKLCLGLNQTLSLFSETRQFTWHSYLKCSRAGF